MASQANPQYSPVELFYSYSHKDLKLCELLEAHLKSLQRSGLIRSWYDREITAGTEWKPEIQQAMERAGIILLLLSADFMASDFIYEIELPFAMKRHESGQAVVLPVLLRPFVYQDAPFAKLQMLPTGARPVIEWGRRDQAFNDIAVAIRSVILEGRLKSAPAPTNNAVEKQERVVDAAIPAQVFVDEPADVVSLIRLPGSAGLKAILQTDDSYSVSPQDVKSSDAFDVSFPRGPEGSLLSATLEFVLQAPGFDPPVQQKQVRVKPGGDSPVCVFVLTPKRPGRVSLTLELRANGEIVASRSLATTAVPQAQATAAAVPYGVVETRFPVVVPAQSTPPQPFTGGEFTRIMGPAEASPPSPVAPIEPTQPVPAFATETTKPVQLMQPIRLVPAIPPGAFDSYQPSGSRAAAGAPPSAARKKSKWPIIAAVGASAAGLLVFISVATISNRSASAPAAVGAAPPANTEQAPSRSPASEGPPVVSETPAPADSAIAELSRRIEENPGDSDLYLQRARAYLRQKNFEAALTDCERAARLMPDKKAAVELRSEILRTEASQQSTTGVPQ